MRAKKNQKLISGLFIIAFIMFGFGYALVPLYNVFCELTGINGKSSTMLAAAGSYKQDLSRWVTVEFDANTNAGLAWKFYPFVRKIKIHPGENRHISYYAENNSGHTMVVQAIPSITPGSAAQYLKKTECFCFNQQRLKSGESMEMPMVFYLDAAIPPQIKVLTLSYTLFDATGHKPRSVQKIGKL